MPRILPIIFGLVGLGLFIAGGIATAHTRSLLTVAKEVPGVVVDMSASTSDGSTTYSPIYEYEYEGKTYRHERSVSSSGRPNMGETATMLIDPDDPSRAKSNTFLDKWFLTALFGGLGALFFGIAVITTVVGLAKGFGRTTTDGVESMSSDAPEPDRLPPARESSSSSGPFL